MNHTIALIAALGLVLAVAPAANADETSEQYPTWSDIQEPVLNCEAGEWTTTTDFYEQHPDGEWVLLESRVTETALATGGPGSDCPNWNESIDADGNVTWINGEARDDRVEDQPEPEDSDTGDESEADESEDATEDESEDADEDPLQWFRQDTYRVLPALSPALP